MIKDLIKKNEKHLFVFIILFPLALGFYKLLTGKKKLLPHLTNPISLINLFIIFSMIILRLIKSKEINIIKVNIKSHGM